jgi:hypothetical protein
LEHNFKFFRDRRRTDDDDGRARVDGTDCERFQTNERTKNVAIDGATTVGGSHGGEHGGDAERVAWKVVDG